MKATRSASLTAVVVVSLGILSGCAQTPTSEGPSSKPSESGAPTASGTPSAEPSPSAPDPEDPSTWIISESGVGPILIDGDFAATLGELPDTWENDTANCAWTAWWKPEGSDHGIFFVRGTESDTAPIGEITVYTGEETPTAGDGPVTSEGLGVGSAKDAILAAYPDAEESAAQIGGGSWIRVGGADEGAHVFFEFREGADVASEVTVTTRSEPSYEVCG